jgi:hypothetical protein
MCGFARCLSACLLSRVQEESNASLAHVKKDAKLMPALVYAMEGWEKQLVSTGQSLTSCHPAEQMSGCKNCCAKGSIFEGGGLQIQVFGQGGTLAELLLFCFCARRQVRQQKPAAGCQALLLPRLQGQDVCCCWRC